ncbi:hypothetical protein TNCV_768711 [Trichonephila clavipes]|nr:hypothetical protein TNCV_768711 [Trichonephila clavipes]
MEAVDRRVPKNSKNWQWMTEGNVSARRSTPANDCTASSRQLAARWSTATVVLMSASSTSAAAWIACEGAFVQDPSHDKPSTAESAMGS